MKTDSDGERKQQLTQAFAAFNALSFKLDRSYRDLEFQVATLNKQLEVARKDRQRQKDEKERLADRLSRILSALPAGVVVTDRAGIVQEINPRVMELFGRDLCGLRWDAILCRCCRPSAHAPNEYLFGSGRRIALTQNPLPEDEGNIILITDITETRELEHRLARKARLSEMGETTARLAHQIRTPLASVVLYVSQLRRSFVSNEARQRLAEKILGSLSDLEMLVNDMLCFARGSHGLEMNMSPSSLLTEVRQALTTRCDIETQIQLSNSVDGRIIRGNRHALVGALLNLATNALEASGPKGQIKIGAVSGDDGCVKFFVSDNGPGVDQEIRDRIFEPFFTTRSGGTGLGLAVVKSVASAHGGRTWVDSNETEGSTFFLSVAAEAVKRRPGPNHRLDAVAVNCVGIAQ